MLTNANYKELVSDEDKVSQISSILMRYNKMDQNIHESLCVLLQKIDAYDFTRLRDDKIQMRHLRCKALGIPQDFIVNLDDIDKTVAAATEKMEEFKVPADLKFDMQQFKFGD